MFLLSLPMRERGLKYDYGEPGGSSARVAPHAGAWIEITLSHLKSANDSVAPHAGAWIEIK